MRKQSGRLYGFMSEFSPVGGSTLLLPEPADNTRPTPQQCAPGARPAACAALRPRPGNCPISTKRRDGPAPDCRGTPDACPPIHRPVTESSQASSFHCTTGIGLRMDPQPSPRVLEAG